jgi:dolichyl-phosphate beta-glucosyltransferase
MTRPYLSVIIPAYNEAARLPLTLVDVDRHLSEQDFASEIIVVVSAGSDNTPDILKRFQAIIKNLRVIILSENKGKGFAIKTGMLAAKGQWHLMMDADNSTSLIEIAKMLPFVTDKSNNCDIAIGSRFIEGAQINPPAPNSRQFMEKLGQTLISTFLVRGIKDTGCGFKLFSASASDQIFKKCVSEGWGIDTEALMIARKLKYEIKEVPVFWAYDPGTHRSSGSFFTNLKEHLALTWNSWTKRYTRLQN